jgi:hypothetical protein
LIENIGGDPEPLKYDFMYCNAMLDTFFNSELVENRDNMRAMNEGGSFFLKD